MSTNTYGVRLSYGVNLQQAALDVLGRHDTRRQGARKAHQKSRCGAHLDFFPLIYAQSNIKCCPGWTVQLIRRVNVIWNEVMYRKLRV